MDDTTNTVETGLGTIANNSYDYINNLLANPTVIVILVIIVIIYLIVFLTLGNKDNIGSQANLNQGSDTVSNSGTVVEFVLTTVMSTSGLPVNKFFICAIISILKK